VPGSQLSKHNYNPAMLTACGPNCASVRSKSSMRQTTEYTVRHKNTPNFLL